MPSRTPRRRIPAIVLAVILVITGAGAAAGVAFDGDTSGSLVSHVDQSLQIAPEGTGISLSAGTEGHVTVTDDHTRFESVASVRQGDRYEIHIDLKNPSEADTAGRLRLHAPDPIELEVSSQEFTNFRAARLDDGTWMIEAPKSVGAPLTTDNPWTGPLCDPHIVGFNDTSGDAGGVNPLNETWNPTYENDIIVHDVGGNGTVSDSADTVINDEGSPNRDNCDPLLWATPANLSISQQAFFVNLSGPGYGPGDEVYLDTDHDGVFTKQADTHLAGVSLATADNGTAVTTSNPWSGATKAVMFHDTGRANEWEPLSDVIVVDSDEDDVYTNGPDTLVDGDGSVTTVAGTPTLIAAGTPLTSTEPADNLCTDSLTSPTEVFIDSDGDCDLDDGSPNMTILGSPTGDGSVGTPDGTPVDSNWAFYEDVTTNGAYDDGEDLYIENVHDELTYSAGPDTLLAGSTPAKGTGLTVTNPFTTAPQVAFVDDPGGIADGIWEAGEDVIVVDFHNGGTISEDQDAAISHGSNGVAGGADGATYYDFPETKYPVVDDDRDGEILVETEDDVVPDDDRDGRYTSQADVKLAGQVSLSTLNGETITIHNPWFDPPDFHPPRPHGPNLQTVHHPVTFFDDGDGAWEADRDSIYLDRWTEDRIVSYDPEDDILLAGTEYGDIVIVVALPDDAQPGFYVIEGELESSQP